MRQLSLERLYNLLQSHSASMGQELLEADPEAGLTSHASSFYPHKHWLGLHMCLVSKFSIVIKKRGILIRRSLPVACSVVSMKNYIPCKWKDKGYMRWLWVQGWRKISFVGRGWIPHTFADTSVGGLHRIDGVVDGRLWLEECSKHKEGKGV